MLHEHKLQDSLSKRQSPIHSDIANYKWLKSWCCQQEYSPLRKQWRIREGGAEVLTNPKMEKSEKITSKHKVLLYVLVGWNVLPQLPLKQSVWKLVYDGEPEA